MNQPLIPVALFAYARPGHLRQTLEGLKRNRVPLIYAFSDGPKNESRIEQVKEVRKILRAVDWAELILIERETNLGLGPSIRSGVSEVLKKFDMVIVMEDDIVMRPGAYDFTCKALWYFKSHKEIMTVSMWNHPVFVPKSNDSGFLSKRFMCWGWGVYKRSWDLYVGNPEEIYEKCLLKGINPHEWGKDIEWQVKNSRERNLWYIGFALIHMLYNGFSFYPLETLTVNFGKDKSAINDGEHLYYKENKKLINISVKEFSPFEITKPLKLYPGIERKFRKYFNPQKKTILFKSIRKLNKILKGMFS